MERSLQDKIMDIIGSQMLGLEVRTEETFEQHGLDSLDMINIVMNTEDEFGITIDEKDVSMNMRVSAYIDFVRKVVESTEEETTKEVD